MSIHFPIYDMSGCDPVAPPASLENITLLPFQIEGYSWMTKQEDTFGGGILADDMGMGKTIQSIALILRRTCLTLIVTPASLTSQWREALNLHAPSLNVLVFHRSSKSTMEAVESCDVCITTYDTLGAMVESLHCSHCHQVVKREDFNEHECYVRSRRLRSLQATGNAPRLEMRQHDPGTKCLLNLEYGRVILDECHLIKKPVTRRARACFSLKSVYRWGLSGTPFQNRLGEFASLLKFLKYDLGPMCTCRTNECDYGCLNDKVRKNDPHPEERFRFLETIFNDLVLRRMKENFLPLPDITSEIVHVSLNDNERDVYDKMYRRFHIDSGQHGCDRYLEYLLRMRQCVTSPELFFDEPGKSGCALCLSNIIVGEAVNIYRCGHVVHQDCKSNFCAQEWCSECLVYIEDAGEVLPPSINTFFRTSSKLAAVVDEIRNIRETSTDQTLVFTCFKNIGPWIVHMLKTTGIRCGVIDGGVGERTRQLLYSDLEQGQLDVLIFTMGCGSVGLNLQSANRVLITCPWWNPALEDQAIARSYRLGQRKSVIVKRFAVENSIDDRILELQKQKRMVCKAVLNSEPTDLTKLDLKFLLGFRESEY